MASAQLDCVFSSATSCLNSQSNWKAGRESIRLPGLSLRLSQELAGLTLANGAGTWMQPGEKRSSSRRAGLNAGRPCSASLTDSTQRNEQLKDAAKGGDLTLVQSLLGSKDVQVNLPSESKAGWTALQLASFYGHVDIVQALLQAGASTEIRNESGNTALQLACLRGHVPIAKILLDHGADIRAESNDRGTVMDYAMEWGGEEMVEFLYSWEAVHSGQ